MRNASESDRVRDVYRQRDLESAEVYTWLADDIHSSIFSIDYGMASVLKKNGLTKLSDIRVLDIGCGRGRWLRILNEWGVKGESLFGIEINPDRLTVARQRSPHINYLQKNEGGYPLSDDSFDLITVKTVFSSILDRNLRVELAQYIDSVCPVGGLIVVFDFRISSPHNKNTIGIGRSEIERLFPNYTISHKSILLAPPIMRVLCRVSPAIAAA